MLNTYVLTGILVAGSASFVAAQGSAQEPRQQPPAAAEAPTTTIVGCVYRERDVPGRAPNVAERLGVLEDYILMETPRTPASARAAGAGDDRQPAARGTSGRSAAAGATATAGVIGRMFKLERIEDDRLQTLVGRRVEATGRIDAEEGDSRNTAGASSSTTDRIIGRDAVDLSEFEVSSIREVEGSCPSLTGSAQ